MTSVPVVALGDVADINPRLDEILRDNTVVSFVGMSALSAETGQVSPEDRTYGSVRKGFTSFRDGDVLVAKITPCFENGKIAYAGLPRLLGFGSTEFHVVRARPSHADARYLLHYLRQQSIRIAGEQSMTGSAGQKRVPTHFLTSLSLPLPPLAEQRRIAEVLDSAEVLRAKRRAALAQLDNLVLSTFLEWLGPDDRAQRQPLSTAFREPPTYGSMIPPSDRGSWLTLRVGNIQDARLDLRDKKYISLPTSARARHSVRNGDLLMARAIASQSHLGKCIVAQPGGNAWAFDSHLMRIRLNPEVLMPEFFRQWLLTPVGRAAFLRVTRRSSVQFNVNTKEIAGLRVPMPPIADQRRFARFESETEGTRTALEASLTQLDALFASLQHRAFRGEL